MSEIRVASPAKINTFLHIHQLQDDGYHHLKTYFQLVSLFDYLNFSINTTGEIAVDNPTLSIPVEEDLCFKAAKLLQQYTGCQLGVSIRVEKNIPDGGGLGGGSSNAATVLCVLNKLWNLGLSETVLLKLGLQLGSDVPVFIYGFSTYAEGRGEKFMPEIQSGLHENQTVVIVKPDVHVSTAKIFQYSGLTKRLDTCKIPHLDTVLYENDFESVVFALYPEVSQVALRLSAYSEAHLTGTGACLYTVLDDVKKADKISQALTEEGCKVYVVKALMQSPLNKFKIGV